MLCFALSSCRQQLQIGQQRRPLALGTATPGIEVTGLQPGSATAVGTVGLSLPTDPISPTNVDPTLSVPVEAPATAAPVEPPAAPAGTPTPNPAFGNVQIPLPADLRERWRQMQVERTVFDQHRTFVSTGSHTVWWFDPVFGQFLPLGEVQGAFTVQAIFRINGMCVEALEMPYHVNQQYNIAIPPAILQRMRDAGVGEWTEVFVYRTRDMVEK